MSNVTGNLYPFVTKAQMKDRLANEPEFRKQAICLLHTLQTEHEQATKSTLTKNRQGFMSSHAVRGSEVAVKIKGGSELTAKDWETIDRIAPRYTRQLCAYSRAQAIANDPALAKVAAMFSADKVPNLPAEAPEAPASEPEEIASEEESAPELEVDGDDEVSV